MVPTIGHVAVLTGLALSAYAAINTMTRVAASH